MPDTESNQSASISRRHFVKTGVAVSTAGLSTGASNTDTNSESPGNPESWLTNPDDFRDVSRGKPAPHSISEEKRREVGLTRDTWRLNVLSDPDFPTHMERPLVGEDAFTFSDLMRLAETNAVRFPKVMTCLNIGCPLGNGIWEGIPLRDVVWRTHPTENLRRIFYHGYHNDDPKQMFRSSLPAGRVLEDPWGLPPVILCYKLNGQWLTPERGGPVRIIVPEAYGFKSIKWLTNVFLSNIPTANDTYAEKNNDVDSPLKTFCATLQPPETVAALKPFSLTGYAQIGISGLQNVQVWIHRQDEPLPENDPYFVSAPWKDAELIPPSADFGGGLPGGIIPNDTVGFDPKGRPTQWPLPLTKVFWHFQHPGLAAGSYSLRCRTIDKNGAAQPMPRPFRKSGHAKIEHIRFEVT